MKGFYWHVHHDKLLEYCWDYGIRKKFIKDCKPTNEIATRLKLFKPVQGTLPEEVIEAGEAHEGARKAWIEAWGISDKTLTEIGEAYIKAEKVYVKAISKNRKYLEQLHAKECLNCSWDGEKIVFEK